MSLAYQPAGRSRGRGLPDAGEGEIGSPEDRKAVLLDCASRLQVWPMANRVYRERLQTVAWELIRLAGSVDAREDERIDA